VTVRDREVLEALRDEPELLAIADAVAETHLRRRRRTGFPVLAAASAAAAALVLLLVDPWSGGGGPSLADRALAAIGDGPIVHAVLRFKVPGHRIELATGRAAPIVRTAETWADDRKGLLLSVVRQDGQVLGRHTSRIQPDVFYPLSLAALYRDGLEQGKVQKIRDGVVRGKPVIWVAYSRRGLTVESALDAETYVPLVMRYVRGGRVFMQLDVLQMNTVGGNAVQFGDPDSDEGSTGEEGVIQVPVGPPGRDELASAGRALSRRPFWLGRSYAGLRLTSIYVESAATSAGGRRVTARIVRLEYGGHSPLPPFILEEISLRRGEDFLRAQGEVAPPPGYLDLDGPSTTSIGNREFRRWTGTLRRGGLYVTIEAGSRSLVLKATRSLRSAPARSSR
jgi:hypothetical protein